MDLATILWLHDRIGNAAPLFMALLGVLSIFNYIRGRGIDGGMMGAIIVGEIVMIAMGILGITLFIAFNRIQNLSIHFLYGSLCVIFIPGLWVYTRGETDRRSSLIWGFAGFFMMGLTLRAIGTAGQF
jgi:hypothetical protein